MIGNLGSDIKNAEDETPINFYDLIPGYTGKPKPVNERKLAEATSGGGLISFIEFIEWTYQDAKAKNCS